MVKLEERGEFRRLDLRERYEALMGRLAYYLLLQARTFLQTSGLSGLTPAMKALVEKAADLKVEEARRHPAARRPAVLAGELARHMGETFSSEYRVEGAGGRFKVTLDRCGCIGAVVAHSKEFGFGEGECRAMFCGSCMGGYRRAAERLGLKFEGALTPEGCYMCFQSP